jgi:Rrf2 family protein
MLQLTKRTEYGLIALVHLMGRDGEVVSVREICERYPVPRRLLAEVLKDLCRLALVESHRGAAGGYTLARAAESISLAEIVAGLEGRPALTSCESVALVGRAGECEVERTCPIRSPIQHLRERIWSWMEDTTLRSLVQPRGRALPERLAAAPFASSPTSGRTASALR